jgi:hypothetical protein
MKRTIESIKENEVVWCKSPEEAKKFERLLHESDKAWCDGDSYIESSRSTEYYGHLCYWVNAGGYSAKEYYESESYIITPAIEFIEDQQTAPVEQKEEEEEEDIYDAVLSFRENHPEEVKKLFDSLNPPVQVKSVPYQLCPMCHGEKQIVSSLRRSQDGQVQSSITIKCHICKGEGIIPQFVIE